MAERSIIQFLFFLFLLGACTSEDPIPTYTLSTDITPTEGGKINISPLLNTYEEGALVTLSAVANENWVFQKWEGDETGSNASLQITMNTNKSITGIFIKRNYPLTINITGQGSVNELIITNPGGREYPHGTTVELTPAPKEGWIFDSWGNDLTGNESPKRILIDKAKTVTANFKRKDYPLTISITGEGTVAEKVVFNPSGKSYPFETIVELTPLAKEGWVFEGWGGDLTGNESPKSITVNKEKTVTARFQRKNYPLKIQIEGEGTVTEIIASNPSGREYPFETRVELKPVPKEGWVFDSWGGDLTGNSNPQTILMDKEKTVIAKFKRRDYPLNLQVQGEGTVEEKVVFNPSARNYPFETKIELTPIPKEGWIFEMWGGDETGAEIPKTILVDKEKTVIAKFKRKEYPLNLNIIGQGTVEEKIIVNPAARSYAYETIVELIPVPKPGWAFDRWEGDLTGTEISKTIKVDSEKNVTIIFRELPKFYLSDNGVTCMCPNTNPGDKGFINGVEYESVNNTLLRIRRNEGKDLTKVCTSLVTDMSRLFEGFQNIPSTFNQPIGNWDVSNVTTMSLMFKEARRFNQPIENWDVRNVTDMSSMFRESGFNQPIGNWNVSKVTKMTLMFYRAPFNQPIGNWNVGNVTDMSSMFQGSSFNQPIGGWNVKNVTQMGGLFYDSPFNQPLNSWDVSNVISMDRMFWNTPFNQPIGNWNVSKVQFMGSMFRGSAFNQPIGNWNVSGVSPETGMDFMFRDSNFNQDLSKWCVLNFRFKPIDFDANTPQWTLPKPVWGTCPN